MADPLQWIICRVSGKGPKWNPEHFPTSKRLVERIIREAGIKLSPEGRAFLDGLAEYFPGSPDERKARNGGA